jgi:hypothetical protein
MLKKSKKGRQKCKDKMEIIQERYIKKKREREKYKGKER